MMRLLREYPRNDEEGTDWATAANWTPSGVPANGDNVTIVATSNNPVLAATDTVNKLTITGGTLDLGGHNIRVQHQLTVSGSSPTALRVTNGRIINRTNQGSSISNCKMDCILDLQPGSLTVYSVRATDSVLVQLSATSYSYNNVYEDFVRIEKTSGQFFSGGAQPDTFLVDLELRTLPGGSQAAYLAYSSNGNYVGGDLTIELLPTATNYINMFVGSESDTTARMTVAGDVKVSNLGNSLCAVRLYGLTVGTGGSLMAGSTGFKSGNLTLVRSHLLSTDTTRLCFGQSATVSIANSTIYGTLRTDSATVSLNGAKLLAGMVGRPTGSSYFSSNNSRFYGPVDIVNGYNIFANKAYAPVKFIVVNRALITRNNRFNDSLVVVNNYNNAGALLLGYLGPDTLAHTQVKNTTASTVTMNLSNTTVVYGNLTLTATSTGGISVGNGLKLQGNLSLNASSTGGFSIGANITLAGNLTLNTGAAGATFGANILHSGGGIGVGPNGYTYNTLTFNSYKHSGSGAVDLTGLGSGVNLTCTGSCTWGGEFTATGVASISLSGSVFNGAASLSAGSLSIIGNKFYGTTSLTKTGATNNLNRGNNFYGHTTICQASNTAYMYWGHTARDTCFSSLVLQCSGSQPLVMGNLNELVVHGNLTAHRTGSGALTLGPTGIVFRGSAHQTFTSTGSAAALAYKVVVNKTAGSSSLSPSLSLSSDLEVNTDITLTSGIIKTTGSAVLKLRDNATVTGASDASYVEGRVLKVGNDAFTFPVGRNGAYRPIAISAPSSTTAEFRAEYFEKSADPVYDLDSRDTTLHGISANEYWTLERLASSSNVSVTLKWDTLTSCVMDTPITAVRVAGWDAGTSKWKDRGNASTTGNIVEGTVTSGAAVSAFSAFTVGHRWSGMGCGACNSATFLTEIDTLLTITDSLLSELWFSFIAVTDTLILASYPSPTSIEAMEVYQTCRDTVPMSYTLASDSADYHSVAFVEGLSVGREYWIKVKRGQYEEGFQLIGIPIFNLSRCNRSGCDLIGNGNFSSHAGSLFVTNPYMMNQVECWKCNWGSPNLGLWQGNGGQPPFGRMFVSQNSGQQARGEALRQPLAYAVNTSHPYLLGFSYNAQNWLQQFVIGLGTPSGQSGNCQPTGTGPVSPPTIFQPLTFANSAITPFDGNWHHNNLQLVVPNFSHTGIFIYPNAISPPAQQGWLSIDNVSLIDLANAGDDVEVCANQPTTLGCASYSGLNFNAAPLNTVTYSWSPATGLSCTNCPNPVATVSQTTTYTLTVTFSSGGGTVTITDHVTINVVNVQLPQIVAPTTTCNYDSELPASVLLTASGAIGATFTVPSGINFANAGPLGISINDWGPYFAQDVAIEAQVNYSNGGCAILSVNIPGCCAVVSAPTPWPRVVNLSVSQFNSTTGAPAVVAGTISGNFTVTGTMTVDQNLTIAGSEIVFDNNAIITVQSGVTLTLTDDGTDNPWLHACGNFLWDRIRVNTGGNLVVQSNNALGVGTAGTPVATTIEDAMTGVHFIGNGNFEVRNTTFNRNVFGIFLQDKTNMSTATLSNCLFNCSAMLNSNPFGYERTSAGIYTANSDLFVGVTQTNQPCTFSNLQNGIVAMQSHLTSYGNLYTDLTGCGFSGTLPCNNSAGWGIWSWGGPVAGHVLYSAKSDQFIRCWGGIRARLMEKVYIEGPIMTDIKGPDAANNVLSNGFGVHALEVAGTVDVGSGNFTNCDMAIVCTNNPASAINIRGNRIRQTQNPLFANAFGIYASNGSANTQLHIYNPTVSPNVPQHISEMAYGIYALGFANPLIHNNKVDLPTLGGNNTVVGMATQGCTGPRIIKNYVYGTNQTNQRGIITNHTTNNAHITCNEVYNCNLAIHNLGPMASGTVKENLMQSSVNGYVHSNGYMNAQGNSSTVLSNNQWVGSFTAHTKNISGTLLSSASINRFWVTSATGDYNPSTFNTVTGPLPDIFRRILKSNSSGTVSDANCNPPFQLDEPDNVVARGIALDTLIHYGEDSVEAREFSRLSLYRTLRYDTIFAMDSLFQAFKDSMNLSAYFILDSMMRMDTTLNFPYEKDVIDSLLSVLDTTEVTDTLQALYKEVLQFAVEHVWSGDSSWSEGNLARLREIAEACPYRYGDGVFISRSLLASLDTALTLYINDCELPIDPSERRGEDQVGVYKQYVLKLFPNPNTGVFTFESGVKEGQSGTLAVSDAIGRIVGTWRIDQSYTQIDMNGYPSGVYSCHFQLNENGIEMLRFIIVKP